MNYVLKLNNIDLIYKSAESLSFKKVAMNMIGKRKTNILREYKALNNVSLTIEKGSVYGVIGNNGAGKSTLLRILSGVMSPNKGTVERNYQSINLLALGVGFSKELSGLDNIYLNGMLLGFSKKEITQAKDAIIEYSEIGDFIERPMKTYSSGMISRLGFAIAIHLKPDVLLIDEVLSVGDTKFREKSFNSIRKVIEDKNVTVVIVSHSMSQIEQLCDKVIWLDKGRVVTNGNTTEILELYNQYNTGKLSMETIIKRNLNPSIKIHEQNLTVDISDYSFSLFHAQQKDFLGNSVDFIEKFNAGDGSVKVTKRCLTNQDMIIYFELEKPKGIQIDINLDAIKKQYSYDHLYQKPPFDNRYGENKVSGFYAYLDLAQGSAVVSKIYYYQPLIKTYQDGGVSTLYKLNEEASSINVIDNHLIQLCFFSSAPNASFFILLSSEKLFHNEKNLDSYMEYYYKSIQNNSVWCSYFMQPSGTYTKLPYSIEPFTKEGYGFSLHHSSRKEMLSFYQKTKERFYEDMLMNAILQAFLYGQKKDGMFLTSYTSTWLKKQGKVTAPYIDTRLNETFERVLREVQVLTGQFPEINQLETFSNFLCHYYKSNKPMYKSDTGVVFPDYFHPTKQILSPASLNHQLGIASLLLDAYEEYKNEECLEIFNSIIHFLDDNSMRWINPQSGDLFYGVKLNIFGKMMFFGKDYVYVTLLDMLFMQRRLQRYSNMGISNVLPKFIESKIQYLKTTDYDIFNPEAKPASGEKLDSRKQVLALYQELQQGSQKT